MAAKSVKRQESNARLAKQFPPFQPGEWPCCKVWQNAACTRAVGHAGFHVAHRSPVEVIAVWTGEAEA